MTRQYCVHGIVFNLIKVVDLDNLDNKVVETDMYLVVKQSDGFSLTSSSSDPPTLPCSFSMPSCMLKSRRHEKAGKHSYKI